MIACVLRVQVAEGYSSQKKKAVLAHFLQLFHNKELSQDHLVVAMQMLILPMLAHAFKNQNFDVVDHNIIKTIVEKLLDPPEEVIPCIGSSSPLFNQRREVLAHLYSHIFLFCQIIQEC